MRSGFCQEVRTLSINFIQALGINALFYMNYETFWNG